MAGYLSPRLSPGHSGRGLHTLNGNPLIVSITTQIPGHEPRYQHVPVNAAHAYMASVGINRSTAQAMLKALARTGNPQTRTLKSGSTVHVAHVRQESA